MFVYVFLNFCCRIFKTHELLISCFLNLAPILSTTSSAKTKKPDWHFTNLKTKKATAWTPLFRNSISQSIDCCWMNRHTAGRAYRLLHWVAISFHENTALIRSRESVTPLTHLYAFEQKAVCLFIIIVIIVTLYFTGVHASGGRHKGQWPGGQ